MDLTRSEVRIGQSLVFHFFIFGLLFLLFDLEIILIYPYSVTSYNNDIYGLTIMIIFFYTVNLGLYI